LGAQLAQQSQSLGDRGGVSGAFDVGIGAVATGEVLDLCHDVGAAGVQRQIRSAATRQGELVIVQVQGDERLGALVVGADDGAQPDRSAAGDHQHVIE